MQHTRLLLEPGVFLDGRHAVWFEAERALAVADLHLGFAWAQRSRGAMMPLGAPEETVPRLAALVQDYAAAELFVLGDIVHRAVPLEPVRAELRALCAEVGNRVRLRLLGGNHDRGLAQMLAACDFSMEPEPVARVGRHRLLHGDSVPPDLSASAEGRIFMGHEHPAIRVGDGVSSVKCPCFLVGSRVIVLPAFSPWAAGSNVRAGDFMSPLAREEKFTQAVAVMGGKLLPMRL